METSTTQQTKKDWFKTNWGILLVLILWPILLSIWIWRRENWSQQIRIGLIAGLWIFVIISGAIYSISIKSSEKGYKTELGNNTQFNSPIAQTDSVSKIPTSIPLPTATLQPTATPQPSPTPIPLVVTAITLVEEFDKNKLAANDKYRGKIVQTTAYISNISGGGIGDYYLSLKPSSDSYYFGTTMQCFFSDKSQLISLSNGQSVTVQGTMADMSLGGVIIRDCSVIK